MKLLDAEGLTSVVATNCEQHYGRPLVLGDRVFVRSILESVSDSKRTGLGTGRFVTTPHGVHGPLRSGGADGADAGRGGGVGRERRARGDHALSDTQIPSAALACGTLRHPPLPACAVCQSLEWDTVEASGRGVLYSFVVVHYPQVAAFDYPLPIGLVQLEEGTRVVANIDGFAPGELKIGQALQATFVDFNDELSLPVFVAAPPEDTAQGGAS
jgi:uncharacterized OB-fold protein